MSVSCLYKGGEGKCTCYMFNFPLMVLTFCYFMLSFLLFKINFKNCLEISCVYERKDPASYYVVDIVRGR